MPRGATILASVYGLPENAAVDCLAAGGAASPVAITRPRADVRGGSRSPFDDPHFALEDWIPVAARGPARPALANGSCAVVESDELRETLDLLAADIDSHWSHLART